MLAERLVEFGYSRFELGQLGIDFVRARLEEYGHQLSRRVVETVDLDRGSACAYLPVGTVEKSVFEFEFGGVASPPIGHRLLVAHIHDLYGNDPNELVIAEHWLGEPSDPTIESNPLPKLFFDKDVYFFGRAIGGEKDLDEIVGANAALFNEIHFVTSADDFDFSECALTPAEIEKLALDISMISCKAYDDEARVILQF